MTRSGDDFPYAVGIDQDEQQEYAGPFCDYLGGSRVSIRSVAGAEVFSLADVRNRDVVIWDLHESDERDRGAILAELKTQLVKLLLMMPGRVALPARNYHASRSCA